MCRISRFQLIGKACRHHACARRRDSELKPIKSGELLSNGAVRLTQIDDSTVDYNVSVKLIWFVTSATAMSTLVRAKLAVEAAIPGALAAAGLPLDAPLDITGTIYLVRQAITASGPKPSAAFVKGAARAAVDLEIERYLDRVTTPDVTVPSIAAE
jgi:hypothetical protein